MNYTNQILNNVGVYDVVSSKEEKIHEELFNKALSEFKEQNKEYYEQNRDKIKEYRDKMNITFITPSLYDGCEMNW